MMKYRATCTETFSDKKHSSTTKSCRARFLQIPRNTAATVYRTVLSLPVTPPISQTNFTRAMVPGETTRIRSSSISMTIGDGTTGDGPEELVGLTPGGIGVGAGMPGVRIGAGAGTAGAGAGAPGGTTGAGALVGAGMAGAGVPVGLEAGAGITPTTMDEDIMLAELVDAEDIPTPPLRQTPYEEGQI